MAHDSPINKRQIALTEGFVGYKSQYTVSACADIEVAIEANLIQGE